MKRILKFIFAILVVYALSGGSASAQQKRLVEGSVRVHPDDMEIMTGGVIDIRYGMLPGAVVLMQTPTDTIYTTTDDFGRFLFRKVTARYFTLKVESMGYESWERDVDADTLNPFGINVLLREKKEEIKAAVVKDEAPVFEFIGDTLKYNVAGTQQIADEDMLQDVLGRLPGISLENGLVKIMDEEVARIYINGKLIFGDSVDDPLRFLAGSQVVSLKVYDQASREERLGLVPKGSKKEKVINVVTKAKLTTALIAQAMAGYGRNMETLGSETDNRYAGGLTGNMFSEKTLISANLYLNNIGRNNEYSAVSNISSVPSTYSRVGYAGAKLVKKFGDAEFGDALSASYSYGNKRNISESAQTRTYLPDENWLSRTYNQESRTLSCGDAHNVAFSYMSASKYIPAVDLSFSVEDNERRAESLMENTVDGVRDGYNQLMEEHGRDYRYSAGMQEAIALGDSGYIYARASVSGGYSRGETIQSDTTIASSVVTSFVSEPQGRSLNADVHVNWSRRVFGEKWIFQTGAAYKHKDETVRKIRYADAVAEANLDRLTSDVHTYKYDTYECNVGMHSVFMGGFMANVSLNARYDHQNRNVTMPESRSGIKGWLSIVPMLSLNYRKGYSCNTNMVFIVRPTLPSYEQIRRDFDVVNPMYITRGNPDLKKATDYVLQISGSYLFGNANSMNVSAEVSYIDDKIVQNSRYMSENIVIDGYDIPKGTTFSTYGNVDGSFAAGTRIQWSARIRPLKTSVTANAGYSFVRDPSYFEEKLNIAHLHDPSFILGINTNFSRKYSIDLKSRTSVSFVYNSRYSDVSYLNQSLTLDSRNRITDWMFINGQYMFTLRHPFQGADAKLQDHMLNAIVGFKVPKSGVEINLTCYDILNMTSSFKTKVLSNYTQTSFIPDFGRIWMVTLVWRFNSTQRGGSNIRFQGVNIPTLGRDYEDNKTYIRF